MLVSNTGAVSSVKWSDNAGLSCFIVISIIQLCQDGLSGGTRYLGSDLMSQMIALVL